MKMETASAASGAVCSGVTSSLGEYAGSTNSAASGARSGSKSSSGSYGSVSDSGTGSSGNTFSPLVSFKDAASKVAVSGLSFLTLVALASVL